MDIEIDLSLDEWQGIQLLAEGELRTPEKQARIMLRRVLTEAGIKLEPLITPEIRTLFSSERSRESGRYVLWLDNCSGDKKIQLIREVRVITDLGLKEAKDIVDRAFYGSCERLRTFDSSEEALKASDRLMTIPGIIAHIEEI